MRTGAFIFIIALLFTTQVNGQVCSSERYLSNIFQSSVSQNVVFGNSPALTTVYVAENVTVNQQMTMDIFFPVGDGLAKRPLVILAYGGGYLFGTKDDEDVWATCDSLAKKGYVTASINYRMNLNVASSTSAVRAIYRAAQDYSSAIRYLKEFSGTYGIDTNYVFVGGVSAGGFSAMHAVYLDDNERPAETFQSGLFGADPDLGCINCAGNSYQHTTNVRGIINLWGALMDTSYIQQEEIVPMALFHGTDDLIVPYDHGFPFTALFLMPEVFGSKNIAARVNHLGGNAELNTYPTGHNIWGLNVNNVMVGGPTEYWNPITDSIISFLYENIRPEVLSIASSSIVCENDTVILTASAVPFDGRACWNITGAQVISSNADSSEVHVVFPSAGSYEVTVVAINHLEAVSFPTIAQIQVYTQPIVSVSYSNGVLEAIGQFASYQWYRDGIELVGETQSTLVPIGSGAFTVEVSSADGCSAVSEPVLAVGIFNSNYSGQKVATVRVYDSIGRYLAAFGSEQSFVAWNTSINGFLFIEYLDQDNNRIYTEKRVFKNPF